MQATWKIGASSAPLPPFVPGYPLLGNALALRTDPLAYFVQLYQQYGPAFRIRIFNRQITVLAGAEANRLLATDGNSLLLSDDLFRGFAEEMNTEVFLTAMDGPHHQELRKAMRRGYARSAMHPHMALLGDLVTEAIRPLQAGESFAVLPTIQHIVTNQLGTIIADRMPGDYFPDLQRFLNYNLRSNVVKMWPRFMLQMPAYRRSRQRVLELAQQVVAQRRAHALAAGEQPNLIDDMIAAQARDYNLLPEDALIAATLGPYIAGIDTVASSITFILYALLKHPELLDPVTQEVDAAFAEGTPGLHEMKDMRLLNGVVQETLRMYPVAPFTPRKAGEDFEFAGFGVPGGSEVFIAQTVTHYLPQFFPDPQRFDPTRFDDGKKQPYVFAPYTLGSHICLGAGIAESQMLLVVATLLRQLRLEPLPADHSATIYATPLPNLGRDFRATVAERRV